MHSYLVNLSAGTQNVAVDVSGHEIKVRHRSFGQPPIWEF